MNYKKEEIQQEQTCQIVFFIANFNKSSSSPPGELISWSDRGIPSQLEVHLGMSPLLFNTAEDAIMEKSSKIDIE